MVRMSGAEMVEMFWRAADHEVEGFVWFANRVEALTEDFCIFRGECDVHFAAVGEDEVTKSTRAMMVVLTSR